MMNRCKLVLKKEEEMTKAELMQILVDEDTTVEMLVNNNEYEYLDCQYEVYARPVAEDTNSDYIVFVTNLETDESDFRFFDKKDLGNYSNIVAEIKANI